MEGGRKNATDRQTDTDVSVRPPSDCLSHGLIVIADIIHARATQGRSDDVDIRADHDSMVHSWHGLQFLVECQSAKSGLVHFM